MARLCLLALGRSNGKPHPRLPPGRPSPSLWLPWRLAGHQAPEHPHSTLCHTPCPQPQASQELSPLPEAVPGKSPGVRALSMERRGQPGRPGRGLSKPLFLSPCLSLALGHARGDASGDHGAMCHSL